MHVTATLLRSKYASKYQVVTFEEEWPDGCHLTRGVLERAVQLNLDLDWFARNFLDSEARKVYDAAMAEAQKGFDAAMAEARKVYDAAMAEPRKGFDAAMAEPQKGFDAAMAEARKGYDAAMAEAWKVYDAAMAEALCLALRLQF